MTTAKRRSKKVRQAELKVQIARVRNIGWETGFKAGAKAGYSLGFEKGRAAGMKEAIKRIETEPKEEEDEHA
jgi:hypothetical protein